MGQRTDTRDRIIDSALEAMREKGFASTTISDIVEASGAPRGSVTFHFSGGKDEIASEVIDRRAVQLIESIDGVAASSASAESFLRAYFDLVADEFAASGFLAGCPVAPIVVDRAAQSPGLGAESSHFFRAWRDALSSHLGEYGISDDRARSIAALAVCAIEGALVVCRADRTLDALTTARDELCALVGASA